jgi:hypothetical protein
LLAIDAHEKFAREDPSLLVTLLDEMLVPGSNLVTLILTRERPNMGREIADVRPGIGFLRRVNKDAKKRSKQVVDSRCREVIKVGRNDRDVLLGDEDCPDIGQELFRDDDCRFGLGYNRGL